VKTGVVDYSGTVRQPAQASTEPVLLARRMGAVFASPANTSLPTKVLSSTSGLHCTVHLTTVYSAFDYSVQTFDSTVQCVR